MKKVLAVILALICLLSFLGCGKESLQGDPCENGHSYVDGICTLCGVNDPSYVKPSVKTDYSNTSDFVTCADGSYRFGSFCMKSGTSDVYCVMYIPATYSGKLTTVVMCHGLNATADGMGIMAKELVQYGYACFCFDFIGGSNLTKSDGKIRNMSIVTEKNDLLEVFDQLITIDYVDTDNIFLYSESQGGMVSALAAPILGDRIKGMIMSYPAFMIPEKIREQYPVYNEIPDQVTMGGCALGKKYAVDAYSIDAWTEIAKYLGPVLIMHGTADQTVPLENSQKAVTIFSDASLEIIDGAGHGFSISEYRVQAMKYLSGFIEQHKQ